MTSDPSIDEDEESAPAPFGIGGPGWRPTRRRLIALWIVIAVSFLVVAGSGLLALYGHHTLMGTMSLGIAVLIVGLLPAIGIPGASPNRAQNPPRLIEVNGERGLLLPTNPPSVTATVLMTVGVLTLGGISLGLLIFALVKDQWVNLIGTVVMGALGMIFVSGLRAAAQARRAQVRGIAVLPSGLSIHTSPTPTMVVWKQVLEVHEQWRQWAMWPGSPITNLLTIERRGGKPQLIDIDVAMMGMPPEVARDALRFYLSHPAARSELGSAAALGRLEKLAEATSGSPDDGSGTGSDAASGTATT